MSKASDFFVKAEEVVSLGGTLMMNRNSRKVTLGGNEFLKSGFVETDLTGIDTDLIKNGAVSEKMEAFNVYDIMAVGAAGRIGVPASNSFTYSDDRGKTSHTVTHNLAMAGGDIVANARGEWIHYYDYSTTIAYSRDNGLTWAKTTYKTMGSSPNTKISVDRSTGTFYAASKEAGGRILKSTNGGETWTVLVSPASNDETWVHAMDGVVWYNTDTTKNLNVSWDEGATWIYIAISRDSYESFLGAGVIDKIFYNWSSSSGGGQIREGIIVSKLNSKGESTTYSVTGSGAVVATSKAITGITKAVQPCMVDGILYFPTFKTATGDDFSPVMIPYEIGYSRPLVNLYGDNNGLYYKGSRFLKHAGSGISYTEGEASQYVRIK